MDTTLQFRIDDMVCGGCVRSVRAVLDKTPGVTPVHVVPGEPVEVRIDRSQADRATVAAAVERAGYTPTFEDA